jgi:hypothetical protein
MASYSDILLLSYLSQGESAVHGFANWGEAAVSNFNFLEDAIGETVSITLASSNVTLTAAQERALYLDLGGTLGANVEVRTNDRKGFWFVSNDTSGAFSVTFKTVSGTGVVVAQGEKAILVSDGTNISSMTSFASLGLGTAAAEDVGYFATAGQGALADSATQPGDLATVATSGAYADLSGTPTLGTAAAAATSDFATAAQGALADTALQSADLSGYLQSSDIGSSVQAYDAGLLSIAGLTTEADRMIYTTGSDTYAVTTLTTAGRAILDDADAAAQRTTLGLVIGTDVQAYSGKLLDIAALTPTDGNVIVGNGTTWTSAAVPTPDADGITFDPAGTDLAATDVQAALEEIALLTGGRSRDLIRLAMDVAVLNGSAVNLDSGVVDEFEDAAGVDAGSSTGETAASGYYVNGPVAETTQSLPAMTSNSLPSGHVASFGSGSNAATAEPYRAFDQASSRAFTSTIPDTLIRQVPSAIKVASYRITSSSIDTEINRAPTAWTLQGSNNGSSWTTLDTRSGVSWSAGANVQQTFEIDLGSRGSYTYHRLNFTALNGSTAFVINELEFFQEEFVAMDLRSVAVALPFTPSLASLVIAAKPDGGIITPDTDVIAYASRDGGTTWTQGNLVARQTLGDGTVMLETDEFDISAQPSGSSGKWRVVTSDGFEIRIQAVAALFGG